MTALHNASEQVYVRNSPFTASGMPLPGSSGTSVVTREMLRHGNAGVKLSHSCQMKGRKSLDGHSSAADEDIVPMSDFAYRKRKVIEKIKGWWRRQCVPKRLASKRRRGERTASGGTRW